MIVASLFAMHAEREAHVNTPVSSVAVKVACQALLTAIH